ncbi:hypothetical protein Tco_1480845, partial [Tanacetum coccineum]
VVAAVGVVGGDFRRVVESGSGDRIDPVTRSLFGLRRKSPPEKFSGGGGMVATVAGRWPDILEGRERLVMSCSLNVCGAVLALFGSFPGLGQN